MEINTVISLGILRAFNVCCEFCEFMKFTKNVFRKKTLFEGFPIVQGYRGAQDRKTLNVTNISNLLDPQNFEVTKISKFTVQCYII